jgi:hypothetical protein
MSTLWERVLARCVRIGDCLVWQGYVTPKGYGQINRKDYEQRKGGGLAYVHRVAYEHAHGPIPPGLTIDHVEDRGCRFKACCEETHLEVVTRGENSRRWLLAHRWRTE